LPLLLQVSEHISTFVSTAEAAVRDIAPEQVSVPSVTELTREAFVAGVSNTQAVRDHVKVGEPRITSAVFTQCRMPRGRPLFSCLPFALRPSGVLSALYIGCWGSWKADTVLAMLILKHWA
jgi:hypothetical protein